MSKPLQGCTVVVTRAAEQQGEARTLLEAAGAQVLDLPALVIGPPDDWAPLDDALADLESFHWIVFSSANGVQAVDQRLQRRGRCLSRRPAGLRLAAVGRKTARVLEELGATADFVPPQFVADSLIEHFPVSGYGLRILLPRVQSGGRTVLAEAFGEAGVRVVEVAAYESLCPETMPEITARALAERAVAVIALGGKPLSTQPGCWSDIWMHPGCVAGRCEADFHGPQRASAAGLRTRCGQPAASKGW